jgi:hypothetical protein
MFAAYCAAQQLMRAVGVLGIVIAISTATVLFPTGDFVGFGVIGVGMVIGFIGLVRSNQADDALKEYQQTRPCTPQ